VSREASPGRPAERANLRPLLIVLLWLGLIALVASQFASGRQLAATFSSIDWGWAFAALAIHLAYFVLYPGLYVIAYGAVGVRSSLRGMVPVLFASFFLKAVVPVEGAGSAAVFIEDALERGQSGAKAAAGMLIVLLADLVSVLPIVGLGLYFLAQASSLEAWELLAAVGFLAFIALVGAALWLAAQRETLVRRLLMTIRVLVNRAGGLVGRPDLVGEDWAVRNTGQLADAALAVARDRHAMVRLLGLGAVLHAINVVGLAMILAAFGVAPTLPLLMVGFGINVVVFVTSIIPQGVGAVEGAMSLAFVALGLSAPTAIAVTLAFRLLNVWMPVGIGFFTIQGLSIVSGKQRRP
jgi:phosphatidylglycerol lysyltransferase